MKSKRKTDKGEPKSMRASVSLPAERYRELERIANDKKVSVAWVVRDALDEYVADKRPSSNGK